MRICKIFVLAAAVAFVDGHHLSGDSVPAVPLKNALLGPVNKMVAEFQPGRGRDYHPRPLVRRNTVTRSSAAQPPSATLTSQGGVEQRQEKGFDSRTGDRREEDGEDGHCEHPAGYHDVHEDL
ncbi:hypothetical protein C8Q80DRAFT_1265972 [Daedaleopsis nitida]|nr:hypothetical protein C8Q80DRAFT_1265972 [Daedaleopsis nitida]